MRVRRGLITASAVGPVILVLAACSGSSKAVSSSDPTAGGSDRTVTLRVAHNSNAAVLPARVAQEKGYFKEQGLTVEFTTIENIASLPPALDKSFDIIFTAPTLMIAATAQGIPMVSVAGATVDEEANPTAAIIASKKSGITSIEQLKDKNLGSLSPTGTMGVASMNWAKKAGVDPASIKVVLVNGPDQAGQLAAGRIDAVVSVAPFTTQLMAQPGNVNLGDPYLQMAPTLSGVNWGSSKEWGQKNPTAIKKFVAALDKGIAFIKDKGNDAEVRKILQGYTKLPNNIASSLVFPSFTTEVRAKDLELWLAAMRNVDSFKGNVNVDDMVLKP